MPGTLLGNPHTFTTTLPDWMRALATPHVESELYEETATVDSLVEAASSGYPNTYTEDDKAAYDGFIRTAARVAGYPTEPPPEDTLPKPVTPKDEAKRTKEEAEDPDFPTPFTAGHFRGDTVYATVMQGLPADAAVGTPPEASGEESADRKAELEGMFKDDLVAEASSRGLATSGTKAELVDRIVEAESQEPTP